MKKIDNMDTLISLKNMINTNEQQLPSLRQITNLLIQLRI